MEGAIRSVLSTHLLKIAKLLYAVSKQEDMDYLQVVMPLHSALVRKAYSTEC